MAYSLQIERNSPITVNEWLNVINEISDIRIDESDTVGINPKTKEEIRIAGTRIDAALWFPDLEKWIKIFYFRRGSIVFKADDWDNPISPIHKKAFEIAQKLNAEIVGDNGEKY